MWYYIKVNGLIYSSKDYLTIKQLIKELGGNYIVQKTTKDLSDYDIDDIYFA